MSIPAVLYDHVPVLDISNEDVEKTRKPEGVISYFVTSFIHNASAPREQDGFVNEEIGDGRNDRKNENQREDIPESTRGGSKCSCDTEKVDVSQSINDSVDSDSDNDNRHDGDILILDENQAVTENDEDTHCPLETIIEDIGSDYVLIPIPSPAENDDHRKLLSSALLARASKMPRAFLRATRKKLDSHQITRLCQNAAQKFNSLQATLLQPIHSYTRDNHSSSIYSSFDWVSETVVDASGNRLILPGSCISLDADEPISAQNKGIGGDSEFSDNHIAGKLIVPARSASERSRGSNTLMVSAHDLLAAKRAQIKQRTCLVDATREGELDGPLCSWYCFGNEEIDFDHSKVMTATTRNLTQQWKLALWKLAQHKADVWYRYSHIFVRQSIQKSGHLLVKSQELLAQYWKRNHLHYHHRLVMVPTNNTSTGCDRCSEKSNRNAIHFRGMANDGNENSDTVDNQVDQLGTIELIPCASYRNLNTSYIQD